MAKQRLKRDFSGKAADMLSASKTIVKHGIEHKVFLQEKRSTWADPFFDNLLVRIQKAYPEYLGIDGAVELRETSR
jgi:hypothetical protein